MLQALRLLILVAAALGAVAGQAVGQSQTPTQAPAAPAQPAEQLTDRQKIDQCLAAVTNAASDPRACVGVVADPCLEALGGAAREEATTCMERETSIWTEHLQASVKELGTLLGKDAPASLTAVQESWVAYREQRCGFGTILYPESDFALVWRATCLLEETGRRAVEVGAILKEARNRGG